MPGAVAPFCTPLALRLRYEVLERSDARAALLRVTQLHTCTCMRLPIEALKKAVAMRPYETKLHHVGLYINRVSKHARQGSRSLVLIRSRSPYPPGRRFHHRLQQQDRPNSSCDK